MEHTELAAQQFAAAWQKPDRADRRAMGEARQFAPGTGVPQSDGVVGCRLDPAVRQRLTDVLSATRGGEEPAIRRESDRVDTTGMADEPPDFLSGVHVAQNGHTVFRVVEFRVANCLPGRTVTGDEGSSIL
jgi:hypothetical protein